MTDCGAREGGGCRRRATKRKKMALREFGAGLLLNGGGLGGGGGGGGASGRDEWMCGALQESHAPMDPLGRAEDGCAPKRSARGMRWCGCAPRTTRGAEAPGMCENG